MQDELKPGRTQGASLDPDVTLIKLAGPRPKVPSHRLARIEAHVRDHWRGCVNRRRSRRRVCAGLSAAALALMVFFLLHGLWPAPDRQQVAFVDAVVGQAQVEVSDRAWADAHTGTPLLAQQGLQSNTLGRIGLCFSTGHSVRLDQDTHVRLLNDHELFIDRGAVYVDSGLEPTAGSESLVINTPWGRIDELGTQFEVRLMRDGLCVRVREGNVSVSLNQGTHILDAGLAFSFRDGGPSTTRLFPAHGPEWAWVEPLAPRFKLNGKSLSEFLCWVQRELRLDVTFDEHLSMDPALLMLSGSLPQISPREALDLVLSTCDLDYVMTDGKLAIVQRVTDGGAD